jgi:nicotinamide mononucleotide transporter
VDILEIAAAALTLAAVWLAVRGRVETWPIGILGVTLYAVVFYRARLYANMALQAVFAGFSVYGWYEWLRGGPGQTRLPIARAPRRLLTVSLVLGVLGTAVGTWLLARTRDAAVPLVDAGLTSFSIVAQWLMTRKYVENWIIWVAVDVGYVALFLSQRLFVTAGLYAVFLGLASQGYREWKRKIGQVTA